MNYCYQLSGE